MERLRASAEFIALKPLCDRLANQPNAENAVHLGNYIERHTAAIQYHLEYILLPIYVHLHNQHLSKDVKQRLIELLRVVLLKTRITTLSCFLNLYTALLVQIYDAHRPNMLIADYEELKESTMKCLNDLIKRSCTDVIESLYVGENAPKLSQGVYTCLSIARTEKLCSLRLAAIETLMTLSHVHDKADSNDIALRTQVADVLMLFLPGIASGLSQITLASEVQNHQITMIAIRAYGRILSLVMEDNAEEGDATIDSVQNIEKVDKSEDPLGMRLKLEGEKGMKMYMKMVRRNREWLEAASTKLNASMQSLMDLVRHSDFRVRKELVIAMKLMLAKCSRNMTNNLTVLVEILISLSEDEAEQVRDLAWQTLKHDVNTKFTRNLSMRPAVQILEENFYKLLTKLPRLIRRSDDAIQLLYLNQLAGYVRLLGKERLPRVMESSPHLKRLVLALVYVAELDCTGVSVLDDVQVKDIENSTYGGSQSFKCFKFIRETCTEVKLMSVCKLLAELGDTVLLVDCIFDLITEIPQYRKEFTLLLNWISAVSTEDLSMLTLREQIHEYYTEPENWYLPIQVRDDVSLRDAQSNVAHCCLVTEGLAIIASNLREKYQKYLQKSLYLVVERAGNGNSSLSQSGLRTLEEIARSQKYSNVGDLLRDNVDYLSYHMTTKMRRVERNPGVLDVFAVVVKYSTIELLTCPEEVVQVALERLSDNRQEANCYGLLKILCVFAMCVRKMTEDTAAEARTEEQKVSKANSNCAEVVVQALLEYYNAKRDSERLDDDTVTTPEEIQTELEDGTAEQFSAYDNQEDEAPKPPSYVKMTESVIKCCLNFLPSKDVQNSLMAMQIIGEGLEILSKWNEVLLPIVHELWHPLIGRFQDPNVLVTNRAWQLLYILAHVSKDFIRSRTLKQVLPSLSQFLTKSAKESYKKDSKSAYNFTQMFKLQKLILSQAATVARKLKLQERQLWQMLDIAEPYLSARQHPALQECCVRLFKHVAEFQGDIVWVKCLNVWNSHVAPIPTDGKLTVEDLKKTIADAPSDYRENVQDILTFVEETSVVDIK